MLTLEQLTRQIAQERYEGEGFDCPHCGHRHLIEDVDVCMAVVTTWGGDVVEFSCNSCDKDFVVQEHVTRRFEAAKTHEDLD